MLPSSDNETRIGFRSSRFLTRSGVPYLYKSNRLVCFEQTASFVKTDNMKFIKQEQSFNPNTMWLECNAASDNWLIIADDSVNMNLLDKANNGNA